MEALSPGVVAAICCGESPRASPSLMAASLAAAPYSVSSIPDLLAESSASAASCALLAL